jgi:hypothetical protein
MFFSKKSGFHCLVLYVHSDEPHPIQIVIPEDHAADVISTMRKLEKSSLNHTTFLGALGPFSIIQDIQGFNKIEIYNDTLSWSEPLLYTDYAKKVTEKLSSLIDEEGRKDEEDLIYFVGEFTMMQDNGFVAPF